MGQFSFRVRPVISTKYRPSYIMENKYVSERHTSSTARKYKLRIHFTDHRLPQTKSKIIQRSIFVFKQARARTHTHTPATSKKFAGHVYKIPGTMATFAQDMLSLA